MVGFLCVKATGVDTGAVPPCRLIFVQIDQEGEGQSDQRWSSPLLALGQLGQRLLLLERLQSDLRFELGRIVASLCHRDPSPLLDCDTEHYSLLPCPVLREHYRCWLIPGCASGKPVV